jgi:hypothetical protein
MKPNPIPHDAQIMRRLVALAKSAKSGTRGTIAACYVAFRADRSASAAERLRVAEQIAVKGGKFAAALAMDYYFQQSPPSTPAAEFLKGA